MVCSYAMSKRLFAGSTALALAALACSPLGDELRVGGKEGSPQWRDGKFRNPEPMRNDTWKALTGSFHRHPLSIPKAALPVMVHDSSRYAVAPVSGLRVTWLGHSTTLVELQGHRLLLDPVWGERPFPVSWMGPKRWYPPPLPLDQLPHVDAVLVSHDHYDHLDRGTIEALLPRKLRFVVPLGMKERLVGWGMDSALITELDWWDTTRVGELEIVSTPARHASGRGLLDQGKSLWMGFAILGSAQRIYYSGDTGPQASSRTIGEKLGPFDLTMLECGQYDPAWPDWHMSPEQTLQMHKDVRGKVLMPVHWGLFRLAYHSWKDPVERLVKANADGTEVLAFPKPGESFEPTVVVPLEAWWAPLE